MLFFVDLKTAHLEVLDYLIAEHLSRIVADVLLQDPAQQRPVALDYEADGKDEEISEGSMIHGRANKTNHPCP